MNFLVLAVFFGSVFFSQVYALPHGESAATQPCSRMTLDEAIKISLKNKLSVHVHQAEIDARRISQDAVWTGYYPKVALSNDVRQAKGQHYPHTAASVSADQLVYAFDGPQVLHKREQKSVSISELDKKIEENSLKFRVEQAFLSCWEYQQKQDFIESLKLSSREKFETSKHKNELDLYNKVEWLKERQTRAEELSQIHFYLDDSAIAQKRLNFLLGNSVDINLIDEKDSQATTLVWNQSRELDLQDFRFYFDKAVGNRPEVKKAQKWVELEQENANIARNSRLPKVKANAIFSHTSGKPGSAGDSHSIGFTVSMNMFDGLKSSYSERLADSKKLKALLQKQDAIQVIKSDVEAAFHEARKASILLKSKKFELDKLECEFELNKQKFDIGEIAKTDFETSKTNWLKAKFSLITHQVGFAKKCSNLMYQCGYFSFF
jgi:outer membrane protein